MANKTALEELKERAEAIKAKASGGNNKPVAEEPATGETALEQLKKRADAIKAKASAGGTVTGSGQPSSREAVLEELRKRAEAIRNRGTVKDKPMMAPIAASQGTPGAASREQVRSWVEKSMALAKDAESYYDKWSGAEGNRDEEIRKQSVELMRELSGVKAAYAGNQEALDAIDSVTQNLLDVYKSTTSAREYYGQWDSQEAYDKAVADYNTRQEALALDVDKAEAEIETLEVEKKRLMDMPYAMRKAQGLDAQISQLSAQIQEKKNQVQTARDVRAADAEAAVQQEALGLDMERAEAEIKVLEANLEHMKNVQANTFDKEKLAQMAPQISQMEEQLRSKKNLLQTARNLQGQRQRSETRKQLETVSANGDFKANSGYDASFGQEGIHDPHTYEAMEYDHINGQTTDVSNRYFKNKYYDQMKPEEVAVYNYYFKTQGTSAAKAYLDSLQETLNARYAENAMKGYQGKTGKEIFFGAKAGWDQAVTGLKNLDRMVTDIITGQDSGYIAPTGTQMLGGMIREDLDKNAGGLATTAYDVINTSANMLPSILASTVVGLVATPGVGSTVGAAMMGGGAAGNAYQEVLNLGFGTKEAAAYGTAIGISEAALERVLGGIGKLGGTSAKIAEKVAGIENGIARFCLRFGGKIGSEALEEGLQSILEPGLSNWILDTDKDVDWSEVAYSALLGGLTGGVFGVVDLSTEAVAGKVATHKQNVAVGKWLTKDSEVGAEGQEDAAVAQTTNAISNPLSSYPAEKQNTIRSYIQAVDTKIKSFVQSVKNGDLTFKRQKISDVSARAAADIGKLLGVDVNGYTHNINTNGVQHILNRHGVDGKQDKSMAADDDIARVGWVLENYDKIELLTDDGGQVYSSEFLDRNHEPVPQIRFIKKIDGTYYVVEAAFENDYKKLWVQSAYLQKNGDVTQTPAEGTSAPRKDYAQSESASPSPEAIIDQGGGIVNTNDQNGGNVNGSTETELAAERGDQSAGAADAAVAGGEYAGTGVSDEGQGWNAGAGTGEQTGGLAAGAGRGQTADRARAFAQRENRINAVRDIEASSPDSFGIHNGSKNETMKLIPVGRQDESLREIDNWFDSHGVRAYFYTGLLEIKRKDGSYFVTPGMLYGDRVFIQADNTRLTPEQIGKHEAFHVLRRENPGLVQRLAEDLKNRYTEAEFDAILEKYIKRYGGIIDMTAEDAIWKIWEEILADAYAGIDPRNAGVTKYAETAQELTNRYTGERGNLQSNGTRQTNGPNSQAIENEPQFLIAQREDGKRYVKANREVITGDDPEQWGKQLESFINKKIRKGEDVVFPTEDGHFLVLTGRSAYKLSDRHKAEIANKIRPLLSDADYALKARAAGHIDELIQVAKFDGYREDMNAAHENDIGEDGFNYYIAFFEDTNGEKYRVPFSAALNEDMETVYNIGEIRKRRTSPSRGPSGKTGAQKSGRDSSNPIIYTSGGKSQEKTAIQIALEEAGYTNQDAEADEQSFLLDPEDLKDVPWYEPGMKATAVGPEQIPGKIDSSRDAMQAANAMRQARQDRERPMNVPKEDFDGTDHLKALGVKVENSVGDYWGIAQAVAQDKAAKQLKKQIRRAETRLAPTEAEKEFAAGIAAGKYYPEDIPGRLDYDVVTELADYYQAEKSMDTHLLREKKSGIAARLQEDMQTLFKDSDAFTPSKALILNYRTPERNMLQIFGEERGKAINDAIFSAVAVNEAERYRFMNRMFDEVRTFEDSEGKNRELTKEERAMTMILMEGNAASEIAAEMEMAGQIRNAAENIKNGDDPADAAREWGLGSEERKLAERIGQWMQAKETMDSDNVDSAIVEKAAQKYGEQFNKFYDAINDFLVAHGYETIGFIRGYAPHLQPEKTQTTMKKVFHRLGIDADVTELPTNIAGMTADFKPNKRWNPHMQHRRGDKAQYDIAKAYESYVEYMSDILYHTDDIMRVRQAVNYFRREYAPEEIKNMLEWAEELRHEKRPEQKAAFLRAHGALSNTSVLSKEDVDEKFNSFIDEEYKKIENAGKYSELVKYLDNYANILAGKQSARDRGAEANGRMGMSLGNKLVQMFGRSQVAGSISSALNQGAQLPQIIAEVGAINTTRAAWDIARGKLKKAAWAQESDFLTGKKGVDFLVTDPGEMILSTMFKPSEFVDGFISTLAVRGEYLKQIKAGKSHQEAMKLADKKGTAIMGSRMKGSKPVAFHAKNLLDSMVNVFQVEALNSWEHIAKDLPRDFREIGAEKGKKAAAGALAGVVVKYLVAAFLLNRFAEEEYGGTPAPFDLFGMTANFIASGEGLTTNEYLCTVLDNAWEKMAGSRPFGTDATALDGAFNLGKAVEDTAYNVANDVPFLRNAAAVMGVGDGTLPIPDIGGTAVRTATNVLEGDWEKIPEELFGLATDFVPGGRQLEKTAQGLETVIRGGRYTGYGDKKKLQYPVERNLENIAGGILFGRSGLDETEGHYASEESALSAKQTKLYQSLVDNGADGKAIFEAIQKWRALDNNKDMTSYARAAQQRDLIRELDMTDDMKLEMYREMTGAESRADKFAELLNVGLNWDQVMDVYEEYCFQDSQENLTATQKATKFRYWIDSRRFTKTQADKIADTLKFFSIVPSEAGRYEELVESGLEPDEAMELISGLNKLEPEEGATSVTDLQKYMEIASWPWQESIKEDALKPLMSDSEYEKYMSCRKAGVLTYWYFTFLDDTQNMKSDYDANGKAIKGSTKKDKVVAAIDGYERLTPKQKDALFLTMYAESGLKDCPWN